MHQVNDINFEITFNEIINNNIYIDAFMLEYLNEVVRLSSFIKTYSQEVGSESFIDRRDIY